MLPEGKYLAQVVGHVQGYSSSGKEQIELEWTVVDGPHEGERIRSWHYFSSEKAAEFSFKALEAAGWDGDDVTELKGLGTAVAEIVVGSEEYNGQSKLKVKWVNKPRGQRAQQEPAGDGFAARLKALNAARKGQAAPAPAKPGNSPF
jgi:hypothetical protein